MAVTTTSVLPPQVTQSATLKLLSVPTPNFIHKLGAMYGTMPRNGGTTKRYRRYNPLASALVPLGNTGVTPPPVSLTSVDIDAQMSFYGSYIELNEQTVLQNQEDVLNEASIRLGVQLRQTEDELIRNMLASTASSVNCAYGNNGQNPTNLTFADASAVSSDLLNNNAYTVLRNVPGENRFSTGPVRNSYLALCSTRLTRSMDAIQEFINVANYPSQNGILESEYGTMANLRFFVSSIGSVIPASSSTGQDVFNIFCCGIESYAMIEQDGYGMQFIYRPALYTGPLAQNVQVGWKAGQVPRLLNDQWILKLRCTLPNVPL
jgi:N4-gp56 family major capsid protein